MLGLAASDLRSDSAPPELAAVAVAVIAAVSDQLLRAMARASPAAAHRLDPVEQRQQLGDVVAVAAGQRERERQPRGVGQQVVL